MILEMKYWGPTKTEEGQSCNHWRIARSDNADCTFPVDERIKELASQFLGADKNGTPRFVSIYYHGSNCLLLEIIPKTDWYKISNLVQAIGSETK